MKRLMLRKTIGAVMMIALCASIANAQQELKRYVNNTVTVWGSCTQGCPHLWTEYMKWDGTVWTGAYGQTCIGTACPSNSTTYNVTGFGIIKIMLSCSGSPTTAPDSGWVGVATVVSPFGAEIGVSSHYSPVGVFLTDNGGGTIDLVASCSGWSPDCWQWTGVTTSNGASATLSGNAGEDKNVTLKGYETGFNTEIAEKTGVAKFRKQVDSVKTAGPTAGLGDHEAVVSKGWSAEHENDYVDHTGNDKVRVSITTRREDWGERDIGVTVGVEAGYVAKTEVAAKAGLFSTSGSLEASLKAKLGTELRAKTGYSLATETTTTADHAIWWDIPPGKRQIWWQGSLYTLCNGTYTVYEDADNNGGADSDAQTGTWDGKQPTGEDWCDTLQTYTGP